MLVLVAGTLLLDPPKCDVFDNRFLAVVFTDECCNGDLFESNDANTLLPLL